MRLKVGGSIFKIKDVKDIKDNKNRDMYGEINHGDLIINICNKYPSLRQKQTILHEAIHAVSEELQLDFDELTITRLSNAFFALILDNKKYFKSIIKDVN